MHRKNFDIVIVTYNNESTISNCINSIYKAMKHNDTLTVIDNNSSDKTDLIIRKEFNNQLANFRYIRNDTNSGYTRAMNQGLKLGRNELTLMLNPDTIVPATLLDTIEQTF